MLQLQSTGIYKSLGAIKRRLTKRTPKYLKRLHRIVSKPVFGRRYAVFCVGILGLTVLYWSLLGAHVQQSNADQLVNALLFQDGNTFLHALFPAQHTFLIKWPIFYAIRLLDYNLTATMALTVLCSVLTVAGLVYVLFRIERRPVVFGTLCLALASVLLLIPAQPYAGGILPVNMAMIATRNIEYIAYVLALYLCVHGTKIRSRETVLGSMLLGLLFVSDKLFIGLSLGGAFLALVVYGAARQWRLVTTAVRWLIASLLGAGFATLLLALFSGLGLLESSTQSAGPYGLVQSGKALIIGVLYAFHGLLINFGANPAYDATIARNIPHAALSHMLSPAVLAYVINILVVLVGLIGVVFVMRTSLVGKKIFSRSHEGAQLAIVLLWSTVAAIGLFIGTSHAYEVDARYLNISLFALFIAIAVWSQKKRWRQEKIFLLGLALCLSIVSGSWFAWHSAKSDALALADINERNTRIAQALSNHHVDVLVGDYWRVVPTKIYAKQTTSIIPMANCLQPRTSLTSKAWPNDLHHHSFAYVVSRDKSLTDYPLCNLGQVSAAFGPPDSSELIAGTLGHPKELLLFYDHGLRTTTSPSVASVQTTQAIVPIALDNLSHTTCNEPTIMNFVAHQDDDLLFLNPDLQHEISAGYCIRTVYVTAGDAGSNKLYWLAREQGSEAAYAHMLGIADNWTQRIVQLPAGQYVKVVSPTANPHVSLVFMHLPDGNLNGNGFSTSHYQSLTELDRRSVKQLKAVDGQSVYNHDQLVEGLAALMRAYEPSEIHTQSNYRGSTIKDHSDHNATGRFTVAAYKKYVAATDSNMPQLPLVFYLGYPVRELDANVTAADATEKEATFLNYAAYDGSVCHNHEDCAQTETYGSYLLRQYQNAY